MINSSRAPVLPAFVSLRRLPRHWWGIAGFNALLLVSAVILLGLVERLGDRHEQALRSMMVEQCLQQVLQLAPDAGARAPLALQLRELRQALAGNEAQLTELDRLEWRLVQRRLEDVGVLAGHMLAHERAQLERHAELGGLAKRSLQVFVILSTGVLALLGWMWLLGQHRLQRAETDYAYLFARAANGMALVGADGRIVRANDSYCAMLGYPPGQIDGHTLESLKHPDERNHTSQSFANLMDGACESVRNERRYLDRQGGIRWIRSTLSRTPLAHGTAARVLVVAEDVSDRVRDEEALRRSAALLASASRMAGIDGWTLLLPRGPLQLGTHALGVLGLVGAEPEALLARLAPASRRALLHAVAACCRRGTPFDLELDGWRSGGEPLGLRAIGAAVPGRSGLKRLEGALQDITETRRYQQALAQKEQRFRAAARVTSDGIWDWEIASGHVWRSGSIAALLGMDAAALESDRGAWRRVIHPADLAAFDTAVEAALAGSEDTLALEYRVRRADGTYADVVDQAHILRGDDGRAVRIVGGVRDLSDRKRTQQAIMRMAASVPSNNPDVFFGALLRHMLQALGADGGGVVQLRPGSPDRLCTVALIVDGEPAANVERERAAASGMALAALPGLALDQGLDAGWHGAMGWRGAPPRFYAGARLVTAEGSELGFIFALFREPAAQADVAGPVMQVFAARASAEIERGEAAARVREQAELLEHAQEAIMVLGLDLRIRYWNRGAGRMYGWSGAAAAGEAVTDCYADPASARRALAQTLETGHWEGESQQRRDDGTMVTVEEGWTLVRNDAGEPSTILKIGSDITEKKAAQEEIRRLAYYDTLTGLPNRRLLLDRLEQLRLRCARHGGNGALMFIDMDNFKSLNDQHGHDMGDAFLRCAAARLRACVRADDTVARLGGDEFVVLLDNLDKSPELAAQQAGAVGASIVDTFRQPVELDTHAHLSTASIGAVLVRDASVSVNELLRQADVAMYQAKQTRNALCMAAGPEDAAQPRADELAMAACNGELVLWLAPRAGAAGEITGALAELRWQHPVHGLLEGQDFMPLAERCGQLAGLTDWLLREACRHLADWRDDPRRAQWDIALPLRGTQLRDDGFGERVRQALLEAQVMPQRLMLVLPDSVFESDAMAERVARWRATELRVAMAPASGTLAVLDRLRRTQVDELQLALDQMPNLADSGVDRVIVKLLVDLGRRLDLRIVATGVSTAGQRAALAELGCMTSSGPLYGSAAPAARFALLTDKVQASWRQE